VEFSFIEELEHHLLDHVYLPLLRWGGFSLSVSKHVLMMWIAATLLFMIFLPVARAVRAGRRNTIVNLVEAFVLFIRDEMILPNTGERGRPYVPYFLSVFFFILFMNLLGMVPFGATATGNIAVTAALALSTLGLINVAGIRERGFGRYIQGLVPPGMPAWLLPLLYPIEILGLLTKSFALCIRLFANMIAGHIVILAFLALIFIFKTVWIAPVSIAAALGISLLELFVSFLQAYIFTLLSAIFVGGAVHPQH